MCKFIKDHWPRILIGIIAMIVAILVIPLIINWIFLIPACCEFFAVEWESKDTLSYYGDVLGYVGTVVLGAIAVYQTSKAYDQTEKANQFAKDSIAQTEKANTLAEQMQKLEQAKFLSMVSIKKLYVNKRSINTPKYHTPEMPDPIIFDMVDKEYWAFTNCYHIDVIFDNKSEYPIVELLVKAEGYNGEANIKHGIRVDENIVYIDSHEERAIRFIIPAHFFEQYKNDGILFNLTFVNVFDYRTYATIDIKELDNYCSRSIRDGYIYRILKVSDVKPKASTDETN